VTAQQMNGVMVGTVVSVDDPAGEARIKVNFPWMGGQSDSSWAQVAAPMAGNDRGVYFMPEPGDEVLVGFDHGDVNQPVVLGYMWSGRDKPPSPSVHERVIQSVNKHKIRFLDPPPSGGDKGGIVIEDAHGNTVVLSNGKITIKSVGVLELRGATITLNGRVVSPNSNPI
jgi:uncharacterized protein involved in type VI secretion and phage assembly